MANLLPHEPLDPEAPGLDEQTRRRRRVLADMRKMSPEELRDFAKQVGILTPDGSLAERYLDDSPSPYTDVLTGSALDYPILDVLQGARGGSLHPDDVLAELERRWVVGPNEVLVRLRRMVDHGLVDEAELRFSLTERGRVALASR
jgi:hypothetical protein